MGSPWWVPVTVEAVSSCGPKRPELLERGGGRHGEPGLQAGDLHGPLPGVSLPARRAGLEVGRVLRQRGDGHDALRSVAVQQGGPEVLALLAEQVPEADGVAIVSWTAIQVHLMGWVQSQVPHWRSSQDLPV